MALMEPNERTERNTGQSDVAPWIMVISVFLMYVITGIVIFLD